MGPNFRSEGSSLILRVVPRPALTDDHQPAGAVIDTARVSLNQVMLDSLLALMSYSPVVAFGGLNLGERGWAEGSLAFLAGSAGLPLWCVPRVAGV